MKFKVVIPARYQSNRFPGKPLALIDGIPMIVRTYRQCEKAVDSNHIVVAHDDEVIENVCKTYGLNSIKTPKHCLTGTDRVACAVSALDPIDFCINVQGDEPVFNPNDIEVLIKKILTMPEYKVFAGYTKLECLQQFRSESCPKVVFNHANELLYASRAPIPAEYNKECHTGYRQVCIYGYRSEVLEALLMKNKKSTLENIEDIELLRFLEYGEKVKMVEMSDVSIAVDYPSDVAKVERFLSTRADI